MGLYNRYVLPRLINFACGTKPIYRQRQKIVPQAEGVVLDIGCGSGLNFAHFDKSKVRHIVALEPAQDMLTLARQQAKKLKWDVEFVMASAESMPVRDRSIDTIVLTYSLCTIPDAQAALQEMHRCLKPEGRMIFCEHGLAPDARVARWQKRLTPVWRRISGGCHMNRDIPAYIKEAGFDIQNMDTMYVPSTPKVLGYTYWGIATHRKKAQSGARSGAQNEA